MHVNRRQIGGAYARPVYSHVLKNYNYIGAFKALKPGPAY